MVMHSQRSALRSVFAETQIKSADPDRHSFGTDRSTLWAPDPLAVVFPQTVEQVQELVRLANEIDLKLVPSGGRTGLSGGAVAAHQEVVVSFDRMNRVGELNAVDRTLTVEAGVVTHKVQEIAAENGLYYPVDFASSGSSQIGGNIATNAGGIQVIRYGMTREWVRGLKVVTGRGDVLELNRGLMKNNTGYDLRHLFIGSEGTLGFIVEATLGLTSPPADPGVMVVGVPDMAAIMQLLADARQGLALTAFEFFSSAGLQHVCAHTGLQPPFAESTPFYVLLEYERGTDGDEPAMALFERGMESGVLSDGVLAQSGGEARRLWRLREDMSESLAPFRPYKNDIAVRVSRLPAFLARAETLVAENYPGFEVIWYGHIGDGNLHLNILPPAGLPAEAFVQRCTAATEEIGALLQEFGGSVSAEHGVGLLKKKQLGYSRSAAELQLMRQLKTVFDPQGVMNPGKIFD